MRKDFIIPPSENVWLAIVKNEDTLYDLYLINNNQNNIRNILINTQAEKDGLKSSTLRYFLEKMEEVSYIKFESAMEDIMQMNNTIMISYYIGMDIFEKEFAFTVSNLASEKQIEIPLLKLKGHLFT